MPIVALPVILFAVGAMICYMLAQPITRALFVAAADQIPVVGRYLARGVLAIEAKMIDVFKHYVWSSTVTFVHWLVGLATNVADFPREVRLFASGVGDALDHAMTVTVHEIVKAFVNPVRERANDAYDTGSAAMAKATSIAAGLNGTINRLVDAGVAGIWGLVHRIAGDAADDAVRLSTTYADSVAGHAADIAHGIGNDVRDLTHDLGDLVNPRIAAEAVAGIAGLAGVVALVETQVMPLVRDLTECSPKLKATCQVNPAEWLGMLEGLVLIGAMPSLLELAGAARDAVGDFADDALSIAGLGDLVGNIPLDPRQWV